MRKCSVRELGRVEYGEAFALQRQLVEQRKRGLISDQFLLVEHPHTITLGRNGRPQNLLAHEDVLRRSGIAFHPTDRGGDITYHGPGQIVGYPIMDLKPDRKDVRKYVASVEEIMIRVAAGYGVAAPRVPGRTRVRTPGGESPALSRAILPRSPLAP